MSLQELVDRNSVGGQFFATLDLPDGQVDCMLLLFLKTSHSLVISFLFQGEARPRRLSQEAPFHAKDVESADLVRDPEFQSNGVLRPGPELFGPCCSSCQKIRRTEQRYGDKAPKKIWRCLHCTFPSTIRAAVHSWESLPGAASSVVIDAASFANADMREFLVLVQSQQNSETIDADVGAPVAIVYKTHSSSIVDVFVV